MSVTLDCPTIECWLALFRGEVGGEQREQYERHLESCLACQERLQQSAFGGDELLALARQVGDPTAAPPDPTLVAVRERLHLSHGPDRNVPPRTPELYFLRPAECPGLLGLLGTYEVREVIGQGGMGMVLQAFDPVLNRLVAIKVMAAALAGSATARRRFAREAKAAAAVSHDHIVTVHGVDEADGLPYLVMQYIPGESLQEKLDREGPLEVIEVVRIGMQAASALQAAHAQGLIHRDIKPANLLLENGLARVKITDFGLARMADDVGLTQSGVLAGTPEYMAPEQARGEAVDHRCDLFSLGSVLYALCTGVPPFRGSTPLAVLRQVSEHTPTPIRALNPDVPAWLEALIGRLLAKDPAGRVQSAGEVAALLEGYLAHLREPLSQPIPELPGSAAPRPSFAPPAWLWAAWGVVALLLLVGVAGQGLLMAQLSPELEPKEGLVCVLVNKNSGRCLSVAGGSVDPGAKAVQGPLPGQAGPSERWVLLGPGPRFRLRNEKSGLVLEIYRARPFKGTPAIQWQDQQTKPHQLWTFEPVGNDYVLRAGHSDLVLGIGNGNLEEGAHAIQWAHVADVPDQLWQLRSADDPEGNSTSGPTPGAAKGRLAGAVLLGLVSVLALAVAAWLYLRRRGAETRAEGAGRGRAGA